MGKNTILIGLVVVILIAVGIGISRSATNPSTSTTPTPTSTNAQATASSSTTSGTHASVDINNFSFSPVLITVKKGTTVTWTNHDSTSHTVTGTNGGPDSSLFGSGETYSFTFNTVGTFPYHCTVHSSMTGTVTVTD